MVPDVLTKTGVAGGLSPAEQDRLARILDDYLLNVEQGVPISPDELLARHPADAEHLRGYLSGLRLFHAAVDCNLPSSAPADDDGAAAGKPGQTIGDYRLVREIGRGGMGVVYEAIELSLKRRVALKVLPFSAARHPKQIARFKNEAQAAAQAQHPNIVPVFSVGADDGVHYYAMQLIEGRSLSATFTQPDSAADDLPALTTAPNNARTQWGPKILAPGTDPLTPIIAANHVVPGPETTEDRLRTVARLGVQAAEALQAAHEYGVIHRDVKPSNLLVDEHGKLWVTDFGLARCRENDGLTQTGDILGTMRYMSPEQAMGRATLVDHRTDVYSLGVTLYELATSRHPAEDASDLHLFFDQTRFHYKSLRHWNRHIAADFETIVLKAIAELPQERYSTAQELADDLQRFLDGKAIQARPPSVLCRIGKWSRRHRKAVYAGVGALGAAVIALTAALVVINRAYVEEAASRKDAEASLATTLDVLDRLGTRLGDQLAPIAGADGVRRQLYGISLEFYQQLATRAANRPSFNVNLALAHSRVGTLTAKIGDQNAALQSHTRALRVLEEMVAGEPANLDYGRSLALCQNNIGLLLAEMKRAAEGLKYLRQAETLQKKMVGLHPNVDDLSSDLATTRSNLALILNQTGDGQAADEHFRSAIAIQEQLRSRSPDNEALSRSLAATLNNYASLHETSDSDVAAKSYRKAIDLQLKLIADRPFDQTYQSDVARTYNNLGYVLAQAHDYRQAEECYSKAILLQCNLVKATRHAAYYCRDLAVSYNNLGMMQSQVGRLDDADASFQEAVAYQRRVIDVQPDDVRTLSDLGGVYNNIAMLLDQRDQSSDAEAAYLQAISFQKRALDRAGESDVIRGLLDKHYVNYARNLARQGKPAEAVRVARERSNLWPQAPSRLRAVAQELVELADQRQMLNGASSAEGETFLAAAVEALHEAMNAGLRIDRVNDDSLARLMHREDFQTKVTAVKKARMLPLQISSSTDGID